MLAGDPPSAGGERSLVCAKMEERLFGGFRVDWPAAKRSPSPSLAPSTEQPLQSGVDRGTSQSH